MTSQGPTVLNWGIVGGGILGMTLAYRLALMGHRVTLYEAASELGGLASAWQLGDVTWDRHYHVTLLSDEFTRSLLQELGLESDMCWVETKTGVYANGSLYSVSNAIEFLQFPPLRLWDKLRLGLTILYGSKIHNWKRLETISVEDWLKRWSGQHTFEKFWLPLLRSKLGDNYRKASATFIWATIARLYAARRTGLKKEMFGYLPGGYARIIQQFQDVLITQGVTLRLGWPVQSITTQADGQIAIASKEDSTDQSLNYDRVVVTTSTDVTARLCQDLNEEEKFRLNQVEYQGIICASMLLRHPLSPYYVTNITDDWVPYTGVIEMTALVNPQEFGGKILIYLPKYISPNDEAWADTDEALTENFIVALERMYSHFCRADVLSCRISRVKNVVAIPTLQYSQKLPSQKTSISGLYVINSAQILNGTLNVNETLKLAETSLNLILDQPASFGSP